MNIISQNMSGKKLTTPRKNTKAAAAAAAPVPAQPAPAQAAAPVQVQPAPVAAVPAAAPVQDVAVAAAPAKEPKEKKQPTRVAGLFISPARVRRHADKLGLNHLIEEMVTKLQADISIYETSSKALATGGRTQPQEYTEETQVDGKTEQVKKTREVVVPLTEEDKKQLVATVAALQPKMGEFNSRVAALSRERTRFASDSAVVLATICECVVRQLFSHAVARVLLANKKIVHTEHLFEDGVEALPLYALVRTLPSFASMQKKLVDEARTAAQTKQLNDAVENALKDFKKLHADVLPKKKRHEAAAPVEAAPVEAAPVPAPAPAVDAENDDEDASESKTSFKFYVTQTSKAVKSSKPEYAAVRISTEIRDFVSDLLAELIRRLTNLVYLEIDSMKVKTVNDVAILQCVKKLLVDGHAAVESIAETIEMLPDPEVVSALHKERAVAVAAHQPPPKIDMSAIRKTPQYVAVRSFKYPTSGYDALEAEVKAKLALYEKELADADVEKAAEKEAAKKDAAPVVAPVVAPTTA